MDLTQLTDQPELTETIGGRLYAFSELPIAVLGTLQTWIREHTPNPLEAVKPYLDGLEPADRQYLLEQARIDAKSWPPQIGTAAGAQALLSSEPGQIAALHAGLQVHQPGTTPEEARRVFRTLRRQTAKAGCDDLVRRIYAVLFGLGEPDDDDATETERPTGPKDQGPTSLLPGP